jgi:tetratricopeptide (TPR) repeat protein
MNLLLDTLKTLQDTNISTILVVAGIIFILLAIAGGFSGKVKIPKQRQKWTGMLGAILLLAGLTLFVVPTSEEGGNNDKHTTDDTPLEIDRPPPQPIEPSQPLSVQIGDLERMGREALEKGQIAKADAALQEAERLINDALRESPNDLTLLNLKGYLFKDWAYTYRMLSMENKAVENIDEAERIFRHALSIDADNASALNGLGSVYFMLGDLDQAEENVRKALAIDPNYEAAQHDLELIQKQRQREEHD